MNSTKGSRRFAPVILALVTTMVAACASQPVKQGESPGQAAKGGKLVIARSGDSDSATRRAKRRPLRSRVKISLHA